MSEDILHKAIELEPDNASAHFTISILYLLSQRDMDKAINSLRTAIEMDSSCIQAYETLASLEMQKYVIIILAVNPIVIILVL